MGNNLCLELAVVGDLKLCERPQPHVLMPGESKNIKANIKVSSTETGIVFGSIVYDANGEGTKEQNADRNGVVLNDIHIDIMDYISPASCSDLTFRAMWPSLSGRTRWRSTPTSTTSRSSLTM